MSIPIANLYFLMVYAWDVVEDAGRTEVGGQNLSVPLDLFAKILIAGIDHVFKRGFDQGYRTKSDVIPGVRGKINMADSIKRMSWTNGRLVCEFDELTHDVVHNQIVKATLVRLIGSDELDKELRFEARRRLLHFGEVSDVELRQEIFRRVQLHSNNRFYRLLLHVCAMLYRQMLPDPSGKGYHFVDFTDEQLERVFEKFVRNYLARHQTTYAVATEYLRWSDTESVGNDAAYLPQMRTDVSLTAAHRKIVVECKFYRGILVTGYRGNHEKIRSQHLYQLFAYLKNVTVMDSGEVEGVLLYAQTKEPLDLEYRIQGHRVRVCTVNLEDTPEEIGERVLRSCLDPETAASVVGQGSGTGFLERLSAGGSGR